MAYTVKRVAALSGVSVRTLHFYDEVGLLKPAHVGANGYRYYEEPQLLTLQQILFYRELGFDLRRIKRLLGQPGFDRVKALESHRTRLRGELTRTQGLIITIDRTIKHLKGTKKMKATEMFGGFSPEQQAKNEQYLIDRFGSQMEASIAQSKRRVKHWTKDEWQKAGGEFNAICQDLVALMFRKIEAGAEPVQAVIRRHHRWLKQFWTPNAESYAGHSQLIVDSELRKAYEKCDPKLPEFAASAMRLFAERELTGSAN